MTRNERALSLVGCSIVAMFGIAQMIMLAVNPSESLDGIGVVLGVIGAIQILAACCGIMGVLTGRGE